MQNDKPELATAVTMQSVSKWYGRFQVLSDIDLGVANGERVVICGPSGSGKSTLIRCLNQLEQHQSGRIVVNDVELKGDPASAGEVRRDVGMVFQHFNLFPHLTLLENCTLAPMSVGGLSRKDANDIAMRYLSRVRIADHAHKHPSQIFRRPAAACSHCESTVHESKDHAVRRAHVHARSGDGQ